MSKSDRNTPLVRLAAVIILAATLIGCRGRQAVESQTGSQLPVLVSPLNQPAAQAIQATSQPPVEATEQLTTSLSIIAPLISPNLDLFAGPVAVPLELRIPSVHIAAPVLAVGLTPKNVMDAPTGRLNDPVWQKAFWYRGSGLPGDSGTATFAGHIDDGRGRPAVFAHLMDLQPGDLIIIRDLRTNLDINFTVISTTIYSRQQSSDPQILAQIYGAGPVAGDRPQPAADGLSHLTLITCAGDFIGGSFDHRLVVYATRSN